MDDSDIFRQAATALEDGLNIGLVTVTAAVGSTPGRVGYKMLVFAGGRGIAGTVGGGQVEAQVIDEAGKLLARRNVGSFGTIWARRPMMESESAVAQSNS